MTPEQMRHVRSKLGDGVVCGLTRPAIDASTAILTQHSLIRCQERLACESRTSADQRLRALLAEAAERTCRILVRGERPPVREYFVGSVRLILAVDSDTVLTVMTVGPNHPRSSLQKRRRASHTADHRHRTLGALR